MIRLILAALCATLLAACASSPAPSEDAAKDRDDPSKPRPVFSHIEIGGG